MGTMFDGLNEGRFRWKKNVLEDELTVEMCRAPRRNLLGKSGLLKQ
jgi:hypothetical protein